MATKSRRLTVTPGRCVGIFLPERFSFQRLRPICQSASACNAEVLPELLGPMKSTGFRARSQPSRKRLKLRIMSLVNTRRLLYQALVIGWAPVNTRWAHFFMKRFPLASTSIDNRCGCNRRRRCN